VAQNIYIGYDFKVEPLQPGSEILIAELGFAGFESFVETDDGVMAYIPKANWNAFILNGIEILKSFEFKITYEFKEIEQTNWNEEWERSFNPITVDERVTVRAPFHEKPNTQFDIIIEPKMSFGTGHHETTHMMIQHILKNDFKDKSVLDMGSGTGVLSIMAEKAGAKAIDAIDIDNWCYLNSKENIERNNCSYIKAYEGDSQLIKGKSYDIIMANINRNILLKDIPIYAKALNENGALFLSGFYEQDIKAINENCEKCMLKLDETLKRGEWVSLKFIN